MPPPPHSHPHWTYTVHVHCAGLHTHPLLTYFAPSPPPPPNLFWSPPPSPPTVLFKKNTATCWCLLLQSHYRSLHGSAYCTCVTRLVLSLYSTAGRVTPDMPQLSKPNHRTNSHRLQHLKYTHYNGSNTVLINR